MIRELDLKMLKKKKELHIRYSGLISYSKAQQFSTKGFSGRGVSEIILMNL